MSVKVMAAPVVTPMTTEGIVYCPICTHSVGARVRGARSASGRRVSVVVAGQKCPRCSSPLDAAVVVRVEQAA